MTEQTPTLEQENFELKTKTRDQAEQIERLKEQVRLLQEQFQKVRGDHA